MRCRVLRGLIQVIYSSLARAQPGGAEHLCASTPTSPESRRLIVISDNNSSANCWKHVQIIEKYFRCLLFR